MKYNLAFKYRIYPNKEQELLINKTFGCVRFVYNTLCLFLSIAINTTLPLVACVLRVYYTGDF